MKKYCIDCANLEQKCVNASLICENFKWKDKRLEAGGRALRVLYYLSIDCYYNSTPRGGSFHRQLTKDMEREYAACWEIMHGCEVVDNEEVLP